MKDREMKNILLVLLLHLLSSFEIHAQANGKSIIVGTYSGENNGFAIIGTYNHYMRLRNNLDSVEDTVALENNRFRFEISKENQPIYFTLFVPFKTHRGQKLYLYALGPNSDIQIDLKADTIIFKGKGSEALTCQYLIDKVNKVHGIPKSLFKSPMEQENFLNKWGDYKYRMFLKKGNDSVYQEKLKILQSYKEKIPPMMFKRLSTDLESEKEYSVYDSFFAHRFYNYPEEKKQELLRFYRDELFDSKVDTSSSDNKIDAKLFTSAIIAKLEANIIFKTIPRTYRSAIVDSLLYLHLKGNFHGKLKERLLTEFMIKLFKKGSKSINYYYNEILADVKDTYLNSILSTYQGNISGRTAYPFLLPDTKGDTISLKRFAGKVIVIDFWFKGCSQCITLEEQMRLVRQYFNNNNNNIVFLSINVDYKKATWLEGIASGKYTDAENINLSLYGLGFKHPFLKYYGYTGFPQLLIIDKNQNVVSAQPNKPFFSSERPKFIKYLESFL